MFKRIQDSILCDLVERDAFVRDPSGGRRALTFFLIELKRGNEVPRDRFSFTVLVSRKDDAVCFLS